MLAIPVAGIVGALMAVATSALAAPPKPIGKTAEFVAYRYEEEGGVACYVVTRPDRSGKHPARGEVYALITHRPDQPSRNVISITAGYTYKPGSKVNLQVGRQTFVLFTKDDTAWARDQAMDTAIAQAIRTSLTMTVEGISDRDIRTTDIYDLDGSNRALNIIDRACRERAPGKSGERSPPGRR